MAAFALFAASCGQKEAQKILVLYYSQNGTTKAVAEEIAARLGADMEEIVPGVPYDGNFQETIERCMKEKELEVIPAVKPLNSDIPAYDVIFLGYPVWFGTFAPPVDGLLSAVDFSGKKIVPFCTFGSGGLSSSILDLKAKEPDAEILPVYGVRAARIDAAPAELDRFLKENGFLEGEYVKLDEFSPSRPVTEEESAIFDAAVGDYPMIHAKAEEVASRNVPGGIEYLFAARDIPREGAPAAPDGVIKVYVLDLDGEAPVFTQVLR